MNDIEQVILMSEDGVEKEEIGPFKEFICYNCGKELTIASWGAGSCPYCCSILIGFLSDKEK